MVTPQIMLAESISTFAWLSYGGGRGTCFTAFAAVYVQLESSNRNVMVTFLYSTTMSPACNSKHSEAAFSQKVVEDTTSQ